MNLYIIGHEFSYEMEKLCLAFFPDEKIKVLREGEPEGDFRVVTELTDGRVVVSAYLNGMKTEAEESVSCGDGDHIERRMAVLLFRVLEKVTGFTPKWGILTGVRPIKLYRKLSQQYDREYAQDYFKNELLVSDEKIALSDKTLKKENEILKLSDEKSFSLYISIPFCPSRCTYCSFVSQSVEKAKKLIPDYVRLLEREIRETAKIARGLGLRLETVYFGGGTPTTLSVQELNLLLSAVSESFDVSTVREFTVEAGRPDTITEEKLIALKQNGVNRISINPQTFSDSVLEKIGRRHNSKQTYDAMNMAKRVSFENINMDLIAGLPTDTQDSFADTIDKTIDLSPDSITVHTLSVKRASTLATMHMDEYKSERELVSGMLEFAYGKMEREQYHPYYLYRQSKTLGNLENTGWSKKGCEGLYNVFIMDETHTILACGAGAVTKMCKPGGVQIERIFNFKFPYEYITGFDDLIKRKEQVRRFYEEFC